MAVASVLEKQVDTEKKEIPTSPALAARLKEDEEHNALIRENFAKILSPDFKREQISEFQRVSVRPIESSATVAPVAPARTQEASFTQSVQTRSANPVINNPMVKTSARADAEIFRADSPINRVKGDDISTPVDYVTPFAPAEKEYEENEDLMPTATTRQYQSREVKQKEEGKGFSLSKKEKIMIGCFIGLVVLLFTVIIINSAIISGMNSGIGKAQDTYETLKDSYQTVQKQLDDAQSIENVLEKANEWNLIP